MKNERKLLTVLAAAALSSGCATPKPDSASEFLAPGRVAIVAARYTTDASFNAHAQDPRGLARKQGSVGALTGAAKGALAPVAVLGRVGSVFGGPGALVGAAAGLHLAPFGAVIGAIAGGSKGAAQGAAEGMPQQYLAAIHEPIERARREEPLHESLALRVAALGTDAYRFERVPQRGPTASRQSVSYGDLRAEGFDSVAELAVTSIGFVADGGPTPSAALEMRLRMLVVPLDGRRPWVRERTYTGPSRVVTDWQADDGRIFRDELDAAYRDHAGFVSQSLLTPAPVPAEPAEATVPIVARAPTPALVTTPVSAGGIDTTRASQLTKCGRVYDWQC